MSEQSYGRTFIIAEAGVNHNGSLDMAKELVRVASEAGADAVKFQTFKAEKLLSKSTPKATYQLKSTSGDESQYEMIKKLELSEESHFELLDYCKNLNIQFISSPFDLQSARFLAETLKLDIIKISSGELTNAPMLLYLAQQNKNIILSTGMSTLTDIEDALGVLAFGYSMKEQEPSLKAFRSAYYSEEIYKKLYQRVSILHCTTEYPAPVHEINLNVIPTLKMAFKLNVGFSDHTEGLAAPIASIALGARVIEKHFTLDRNLPGPDHKASVDPSELKKLISEIRNVEKALGDGIKKPFPSEIENIKVARKSLIASKPIKAGELFSEDNIEVKRPGTGKSPLNYWDILGAPASRNYDADEVI
ncbi:N-acetylneuraminate synthase [Paenibacillus alginolyticus]|uniref:N-acetylneuraminate synthase n=1 Tax=Paenibacillus alginolyticus TaxID=59839 RepID=A0ABT4G8V8_9BACL|nr:N-acetylneuraminate synthase [Paenibacillus alginolyticus]MCY9692553.1 N-acetylneuraminate synthase [Paenibacillus alginolyticus]MEC0143759.1 N-acetylneuraminate synthase [Paenibacillus alginolyticus]